MPSYFVSQAFLHAGIIQIFVDPQGIVAKTEVNSGVRMV
jgi:hypothetical protein